MIKDKNVAWDAGIDPSKINDAMIANRVYCFGDTDGASYYYWRSKLGKEKTFTSLASAYAALSNDSNSIGRNDAIFLAPDSNSLAATITWSKNQCKLIGMYPEARMAHRSRIGHSANFTPLTTISGYGNEFRNIYWQHGRGNSGNTVGLSVTGNRNSFINCHIAGPMNDTEAAVAGYKLLSITGSENYFRSCTIGVDSIKRSAANCLVSLEAASARTVFEDCMFISWSTADAFFVKAAALADRSVTFKNCIFYNWIYGGGAAMTYAFSSASTSLDIIMDKSVVVGATDLIATGQVAFIHCTPLGETAAKVGLSLNPSVS